MVAPSTIPVAACLDSIGELSRFPRKKNKKRKRLLTPALILFWENCACPFPPIAAGLGYLNYTTDSKNFTEDNCPDWSRTRIFFFSTFQKEFRYLPRCSVSIFRFVFIFILSDSPICYTSYFFCRFTFASRSPRVKQEKSKLEFHFKTTIALSPTQKTLSLASVLFFFFARNY